MTRNVNRAPTMQAIRDPIQPHPSTPSDPMQSHLITSNPSLNSGAQSRVGHREEAIGVEQRAGGGDILVERGGFGSLITSTRLLTPGHTPSR
jgi:hypothetical protein